MAIDEDARGAAADLVRVSDGNVTSSQVRCPNSAHVAGGVLTTPTTAA